MRNTLGKYNNFLTKQLLATSAVPHEGSVFFCEMLRSRCNAADNRAQVARSTRWVGRVSDVAGWPSIRVRILRASSTPASMKFWCTELNGGT